jgi:hypothetical protein
MSRIAYFIDKRLTDGDHFCQNLVLKHSASNINVLKAITCKFYANLILYLRYYYYYTDKTTGGWRKLRTEELRDL